MNDQIRSQADLAVISRETEAPLRVSALPMVPGGVDPLGLRQLNFELMDRALPGVNNVASRLRIYILLAWAWWKAGRLAAAEGRREVKIDRLLSYVERMEVLFAVSHLVHDDFVGFLGRDTLNAKVVRKEGFDFGSSAWEAFRKDRRLVSSFMAPVAYGPSAKVGLGLGVIAPALGGAFAPVEEVMPAVFAFDSCIQPILSEPTFSQLDGGYVSLSDMTRFYGHWRASDLTNEEVAAGRDRLHSKERAVIRRQTIDLLSAIVGVAHKPMTVTELRHALASGRVGETVFQPPEELASTMKVWRALLARQLLRISLEGLLNWALSVCTVPMAMGDLAERLTQTSGVPTADTVGSWLNDTLATKSFVADPVILIERLTEERQYLRPDLALEGLRASILISLSEADAGDLYDGQVDRLPLATAAARLEAISALPFREGLEQIIAEWIIGQHVYWAVGRSGDDTQRLRLMLDEGGWLSFFGKPGNAAATPDRLATILRLMSDCKYVSEHQIGDQIGYAAADQ